MRVEQSLIIYQISLQSYTRPPLCMISKLLHWYFYTRKIDLSLTEQFVVKRKKYSCFEISYIYTRIIVCLLFLLSFQFLHESCLYPFFSSLLFFLPIPYFDTDWRFLLKQVSIVCVSLLIVVNYNNSFTIFLSNNLT